MNKNEWPAFIIFPSISDRADVLSFLLVPEPTFFAQALSSWSFGDALPLLGSWLCLPSLLLWCSWGLRTWEWRWGEVGRQLVQGRRAVPLWWASWVGRGTGLGQQPLPVLSPSCLSSVGLHNSPAPFSACFPHQPAPLDGLASHWSPFLGDFSDPGLHTLGPLHWGVKGGDWSQPPAPLCLLGHVTPGCSRKHNKN